MSTSFPDFEKYQRLLIYKSLIFSSAISVHLEQMMHEASEGTLLTCFLILNGLIKKNSAGTCKKILKLDARASALLRRRFSDLIRIHMKRKLFIHPDLRSGDGKAIITHEKDWWIKEEPAIAHNLNGEKGNVSYRGRKGTPREGQQIVLNPCGQIVTTPENIGTPDFFSPDGIVSGFGHMFFDVLPWLLLGNNQHDKTTVRIRTTALIKGLTHYLGRSL